jgi:hypothetical protein
MSYGREAADVIRDWREVLHEIGRVAPASPEAVRLTAESQRLQDEYFRLGEKASLTRDSLPLPQLK